MDNQKFIGRCVEELIQNNISVFIHAKKRVKDCGGWFDIDKKEFIVAYKNDMAFEIFIHEYCHFLQWKEDPEIYECWVEGPTILFDWVEGTDYPEEELDEALLNTIRLEWDCERRSLDLIKSFGLDVDCKRYAQGSNGYLLFYQYLRLTRKWSTKKSPYHRSIRKKFSNKLEGLEFYQDTSNLTDNIKELFDKIS